MDADSWLAGHRHTFDLVPFLGMIAGTRRADRPMITRTIENLLTAGIAAGVVMWSNDKVQDYKLEAVQATIRTLAAETRAEMAQQREAITAMRVELAGHTAAALSTAKGAPAP